MDDRARVEQLLGRPPRGRFDVLVRRRDGDPVVVRNAPFLDDGTPMPTTYYLVDPVLVREVSRLEAAGGVDRAEQEVPADALEAAHDRYAAAREREIPGDHLGPRPSGGVGGTRTGVKCLHAHLAHHLVLGDDPVGAWTLARLPPDVVEDLVVEHGVDAARTATETGATAATATTSDADATGATTQTGSTGATAATATTGDGTSSSAPLVVDVRDDTTEIRLGDDTWTMPVGAVDSATEVTAHDPPWPEDLSNAIGLVRDHFEDIVMAAPDILSALRIVAIGQHVEMLSRVEVGADRVPEDYRLVRADAEDVFRTLVAEPAAERADNPGLDPAHADTVLGTCCVVLGVMRRLRAEELHVAPAVDGAV